MMNYEALAIINSLHAPNGFAPVVNIRAQALLEQRYISNAIDFYGETGLKGE